MIIIAFHTTADAFGFEEIAKRCGLEGRLGTIPRSISAGCGFAWLGRTGFEGKASAVHRPTGTRVRRDIRTMRILNVTAQKPDSTGSGVYLAEMCVAKSLLAIVPQ